MKIGIAGYGFVGRALHHGLSYKLYKLIERITIYDKYLDEEKIVKFISDANLRSGLPSVTIAESLEYFEACDIIFLCLPTPTNFETGKQDLTAFHEVFSELKERGIKVPVIIKSTLLPGTCTLLEQKYGLNIIYNPEFLTESDYLNDFYTQDRIVIGGEPWARLVLQALYKEGWPDAKYSLMTNTEAETVKYTANCFLATKISYFNMIKNFCDVNNLNYEKVLEPVTQDSRIGKWGTIVPGPDGFHGFGKSCFPKDLVAFKKHMESDDGIEPPMSALLDAAWRINLNVREKQEWLNLPAASSDKSYGENNG